MKFMIIIISILLSATFFFSENFAEERPEIGKYPVFYEGNFEGRRITVTILRIGPKKAEEVLIQVKGYDHKLDGYIVKCKKKWLIKKSDSFYYTTSGYPDIDNWNVFYNELSWGSHYQKIFPPGIEKAVRVVSCNGNIGADLLLTEYLNQKKK